MAQIRGFLRETGEPSDWKPLACSKVGNEYILKVDTEAGSGVPEHHNGSVDNTVWEDITFSGVCRSILIENTSTVSGRNLLVSFDGGTKYSTLLIGDNVSVDCGISGMKVKGTDAIATDYEILVVV